MGCVCSEGLRVGESSSSLRVVLLVLVSGKEVMRQGEAARLHGKW